MNNLILMMMFLLYIFFKQSLSYLLTSRWSRFLQVLKGLLSLASYAASRLGTRLNFAYVSVVLNFSRECGTFRRHLCILFRLVSVGVLLASCRRHITRARKLRKGSRPGGAGIGQRAWADAGLSGGFGSFGKKLKIFLRLVSVGVLLASCRRHITRAWKLQKESRPGGVGIWQRAWADAGLSGGFGSFGKKLKIFLRLVSVGVLLASCRRHITRARKLQKESRPGPVKGMILGYVRIFRSLSGGTYRRHIVALVGFAILAWGWLRGCFSLSTTAKIKGVAAIGRYGRWLELGNSYFVERSWDFNVQLYLEKFLRFRFLLSEGFLFQKAVWNFSVNFFEGLSLLSRVYAENGLSGGGLRAQFEILERFMYIINPSFCLNFAEAARVSVDRLGFDRWAGSGAMLVLDGNRSYWDESRVVLLKLTFSGRVPRDLSLSQGGPKFGGVYFNQSYYLNYLLRVTNNKYRLVSLPWHDLFAGVERVWTSMPYVSGGTYGALVRREAVNSNVQSTFFKGRLGTKFLTNLKEATSQLHAWLGLGTYGLKLGSVQLVPHWASSGEHVKLIYNLNSLSSGDRLKLWAAWCGGQSGALLELKEVATIARAFLGIGQVQNVFSAWRLAQLYGAVMLTKKKQAGLLGAMDSVGGFSEATSLVRTFSRWHELEGRFHGGGTQLAKAFLRKTSGGRELVLQESQALSLEPRGKVRLLGCQSSPNLFLFHRFKSVSLGKAPIITLRSREGGLLGVFDFGLTLPPLYGAAIGSNWLKIYENMEMLGFIGNKLILLGPGSPGSTVVDRDTHLNFDAYFGFWGLRENIYYSSDLSKIWLGWWLQSGEVGSAKWKISFNLKNYAVPFTKTLDDVKSSATLSRSAGLIPDGLRKLSMLVNGLVAIRAKHRDVEDDLLTNLQTIITFITEGKLLGANKSLALGDAFHTEPFKQFQLLERFLLISMKLAYLPGDLLKANSWVQFYYLEHLRVLRQLKNMCVRLCGEDDVSWDNYGTTLRKLLGYWDGLRDDVDYYFYSFDVAGRYDDAGNLQGATFDAYKVHFLGSLDGLCGSGGVRSVEAEVAVCDPDTVYGSGVFGDSVGSSVELSEFHKLGPGIVKNVVLSSGGLPQHIVRRVVKLDLFSKKSKYTTMGGLNSEGGIDFWLAPYFSSDTPDGINFSRIPTALWFRRLYWWGLVGYDRNIFLVGPYLNNLMSYVYLDVSGGSAVKDWLCGRLSKGIINIPTELQLFGIDLVTSREPLRQGSVRVNFYYTRRSPSMFLPLVPAVRCKSDQNFILPYLGINIRDRVLVPGFLLLGTVLDDFINGVRGSLSWLQRGGMSGVAGFGQFQLELLKSFGFLYTSKYGINLLRMSAAFRGLHTLQGNQSGFLDLNEVSFLNNFFCKGRWGILDVRHDWLLSLNQFLIRSWVEWFRRLGTIKNVGNFFLINSDLWDSWFINGELISGNSYVFSASNGVVANYSRVSAWLDLAGYLPSPLFSWGKQLLGIQKYFPMSVFGDHGIIRESLPSIGYGVLMTAPANPFYKGSDVGLPAEQTAWWVNGLRANAQGLSYTSYLRRGLGYWFTKLGYVAEGWPVRALGTSYGVQSDLGSGHWLAWNTLTGLVLGLPTLYPNNSLNVYESLDALWGASWGLEVTQNPVIWWNFVLHSFSGGKLGFFNHNWPPISSGAGLGANNIQSVLGSASGLVGLGLFSNVNSSQSYTGLSSWMRFWGEPVVEAGVALMFPRNLQIHHSYISAVSAGLRLNVGLANWAGKTLFSLSGSSTARGKVPFARGHAEIQRDVRLDENLNGNFYDMRDNLGRLRSLRLEMENLKIEGKRLASGVISLFADYGIDFQQESHRHQLEFSNMFKDLPYFEGLLNDLSVEPVRLLAKARREVKKAVSHPLVGAGDRWVKEAYAAWADSFIKILAIYGQDLAQRRVLYKPYGSEMLNLLTSIGLVEGWLTEDVLTTYASIFPYFPYIVGKVPSMRRERIYSAGLSEQDWSRVKIELSAVVNGRSSISLLKSLRSAQRNLRHSLIEHVRFIAPNYEVPRVWLQGLRVLKSRNLKEGLLGNINVFRNVLVDFGCLDLKIYKIHEKIILSQQGKKLVDHWEQVRKRLKAGFRPSYNQLFDILMDMEAFAGSYSNNVIFEKFFLPVLQPIKLRLLWPSEIGRLSDKSQFFLYTLRAHLVEYNSLLSRLVTYYKCFDKLPFFSHLFIYGSDFGMFAYIDQIGKPGTGRDRELKMLAAGFRLLFTNENSPFKFAGNLMWRQNPLFFYIKEGMSGESIHATLNWVTQGHLIVKAHANLTAWLVESEDVLSKSGNLYPILDKLAAQLKTLAVLSPEWSYIPTGAETRRELRLREQLSTRHAVTFGTFLTVALDVEEATILQLRLQRNFFFGSLRNSSPEDLWLSYVRFFNKLTGKHLSMKYEPAEISFDKVLRDIDAMRKSFNIGVIGEMPYTPRESDEDKAKLGNLDATVAGLKTIAQLLVKDLSDIGVLSFGQNPLDMFGFLYNTRVVLGKAVWWLNKYQSFINMGVPASTIRPLLLYKTNPSDLLRVPSLSRVRVEPLIYPSGTKALRHYFNIVEREKRARDISLPSSWLTFVSEKKRDQLGLVRDSFGMLNPQRDWSGGEQLWVNLKDTWGPYYQSLFAYWVEQFRSEDLLKNFWLGNSFGAVREKWSARQLAMSSLIANLGKANTPEQVYDMTYYFLDGVRGANFKRYGKLFGGVSSKSIRILVGGPKELASGLRAMGWEGTWTKWLFASVDDVGGLNLGETFLIKHELNPEQSRAAESLLGQKFLLSGGAEKLELIMQLPGSSFLENVVGNVKPLSSLDFLRGPLGAISGTLPYVWHYHAPNVDLNELCWVYLFGRNIEDFKYASETDYVILLRRVLRQFYGNFLSRVEMKIERRNRAVYGAMAGITEIDRGLRAITLQIALLQSEVDQCLQSSEYIDPTLDNWVGSLFDEGALNLNVVKFFPLSTFGRLVTSRSRERVTSNFFDLWPGVKGKFLEVNCFRPQFSTFRGPFFGFEKVFWDLVFYRYTEFKKFLDAGVLLGSLPLDMHSSTGGLGVVVAAGGNTFDTFLYGWRGTHRQWRQLFAAKGLSLGGSVPVEAEARRNLREKFLDLDVVYHGLLFDFLYGRVDLVTVCHKIVDFLKILDVSPVKVLSPVWPLTINKAELILGFCQTRCVEGGYPRLFYDFIARRWASDRLLVALAAPQVPSQFLGKVGSGYDLIDLGLLKVLTLDVGLFNLGPLNLHSYFGQSSKLNGGAFMEGNRSRQLWLGSRDYFLNSFDDWYLGLVPFLRGNVALGRIGLIAPPYVKPTVLLKSDVVLKTQRDFGEISLSDSVGWGESVNVGGGLGVTWRTFGHTSFVNLLASLERGSLLGKRGEAGKLFFYMLRMLPSGRRPLVPFLSFVSGEGGLMGYKDTAKLGFRSFTLLNIFRQKDYFRTVFGRKIVEGSYDTLKVTRSKVKSLSLSKSGLPWKLGARKNFRYLNRVGYLDTTGIERRLHRLQLPSFDEVGFGWGGGRSKVSGLDEFKASHSYLVVAKVLQALRKESDKFKGAVGGSQGKSLAFFYEPRSAWNGIVTSNSLNFLHSGGENYSFGLHSVYINFFFHKSGEEWPTVLNKNVVKNLFMVSNFLYSNKNLDQSFLYPQLHKAELLKSVQGLYGDSVGGGFFMTNMQNFMLRALEHQLLGFGFLCGSSDVGAVNYNDVFKLFPFLATWSVTCLLDNVNIVRYLSQGNYSSANWFTLVLGSWRVKNLMSKLFSVNFTRKGLEFLLRAYDGGSIGLSYNQLFERSFLLREVGALSDFVLIGAASGIKLDPNYIRSSFRGEGSVRDTLAGLKKWVDVYGSSVFPSILPLFEGGSGSQQAGINLARFSGVDLKFRNWLSVDGDLVRVARRFSPYMQDKNFIVCVRDVSLGKFLDVLSNWSVWANALTARQFRAGLKLSNFFYRQPYGVSVLNKMFISHFDAWLGTENMHGCVRRDVPGAIYYGLVLKEGGVDYWLHGWLSLVNLMRANSFHTIKELSEGHLNSVGISDIYRSAPVRDTFVNLEDTLALDLSGVIKTFKVSYLASQSKMVLYSPQASFNTFFERRLGLRSNGEGNFFGLLPYALSFDGASVLSGASGKNFVSLANRRCGSKTILRKPGHGVDARWDGTLASDHNFASGELQRYGISEFKGGRLIGFPTYEWTVRWKGLQVNRVNKSFFDDVTVGDLSYVAKSEEDFIGLGGKFLDSWIAWVQGTDPYGSEEQVPRSKLGSGLRFNQLNYAMSSKFNFLRGVYAYLLMINPNLGIIYAKPRLQKFCYTDGRLLLYNESILKKLYKFYISSTVVSEGGLSNNYLLRQLSKLGPEFSAYAIFPTIGLTGGLKGVRLVSSNGRSFFTILGEARGLGFTIISEAEWTGGGAFNPAGVWGGDFIFLNPGCLPEKFLGLPGIPKRLWGKKLAWLCWLDSKFLTEYSANLYWGPLMSSTSGISRQLHRQYLEGNFILNYYNNWLRIFSGFSGRNANVGREYVTSRFDSFFLNYCELLHYNIYGLVSKSLRGTLQAMLSQPSLSLKWLYFERLLTLFGVGFKGEWVYKMLSEPAKVHWGSGAVRSRIFDGFYRGLNSDVELRTQAWWVYSEDVKKLLEVDYQRRFKRSTIVGHSSAGPVQDSELLTTALLMLERGGYGFSYFGSFRFNWLKFLLFYPIRPSVTNVSLYSSKFFKGLGSAFLSRSGSFYSSGVDRAWGPGVRVLLNSLSRVSSLKPSVVLVYVPLLKCGGCVGKQTLFLLNRPYGDGGSLADALSRGASLKVRFMYNFNMINFSLWRWFYVGSVSGPESGVKFSLIHYALDNLHPVFFVLDSLSLGKIFNILDDAAAWAAVGPILQQYKHFFWDRECYNIWLRGLGVKNSVEERGLHLAQQGDSQWAYGADAALPGLGSSGDNYFLQLAKAPLDPCYGVNHGPATTASVGELVAVDIMNEEQEYAKLLGATKMYKKDPAILELAEISLRWYLERSFFGQNLLTAQLFFVPVIVDSLYQRGVSSRYYHMFTHYVRNILTSLSSSEKVYTRTLLGLLSAKATSTSGLIKRLPQTSLYAYVMRGSSNQIASSSYGVNGLQRGPVDSGPLKLLWGLDGSPLSLVGGFAGLTSIGPIKFSSYDYMRWRVFLQTCWLNGKAIKLLYNGLGGTYVYKSSSFNYYSEFLSKQRWTLFKLVGSFSYPKVIWELPRGNYRGEDARIFSVYSHYPSSRLFGSTRKRALTLLAQQSEFLHLLQAYFPLGSYVVKGENMGSSIKNVYDVLGSAGALQSPDPFVGGKFRNLQSPFSGLNFEQFELDRGDSFAVNYWHTLFSFFGRFNNFMKTKHLYFNISLVKKVNINSLGMELRSGFLRQVASLFYRDPELFKNILYTYEGQRVSVVGRPQVRVKSLNRLLSVKYVGGLGGALWERKGDLVADKWYPFFDTRSLSLPGNKGWGNFNALLLADVSSVFDRSLILRESSSFLGTALNFGNVGFFFREGKFAQMYFAIPNLRGFSGIGSLGQALWVTLTTAGKTFLFNNLVSRCSLKRNSFVFSTYPYKFGWVSITGAGMAPNSFRKKASPVRPVTSKILKGEQVGLGLFKLANLLVWYRGHGNGFFSAPNAWGALSIAAVRGSSANISRNLALKTLRSSYRKRTTGWGFGQGTQTVHADLVAQSVPIFQSRPATAFCNSLQHFAALTEHLNIESFEFKRFLYPAYLSSLSLYLNTLARGYGEVTDGTGSSSSTLVSFSALAALSRGRLSLYRRNNPELLEPEELQRESSFFNFGDLTEYSGVAETMLKNGGRQLESMTSALGEASSALYALRGFVDVSQSPQPGQLFSKLRVLNEFNGVGGQDKELLRLVFGEMGGFGFYGFLRALELLQPNLSHLGFKKIALYLMPSIQIDQGGYYSYMLDTGVGLRGVLCLESKHMQDSRILRNFWTYYFLWLEYFEVRGFESYEFAFYADVLGDLIKGSVPVDNASMHLVDKIFILKSSDDMSLPISETLADEVGFLNRGLFDTVVDNHARGAIRSLGLIGNRGGKKPNFFSEEGSWLYVHTLSAPVLLGAKFLTRGVAAVKGFCFGNFDYELATPGVSSPMLGLNASEKAGSLLSFALDGDLVNFDDGTLERTYIGSFGLAWEAESTRVAYELGKGGVDCKFEFSGYLDQAKIFGFGENLLGLEPLARAYQSVTPIKAISWFSLPRLDVLNLAYGHGLCDWAESHRDINFYAVDVLRVGPQYSILNSGLYKSASFGKTALGSLLPNFKYWVINGQPRQWGGLSYLDNLQKKNNFMELVGLALAIGGGKHAWSATFASGAALNLDGYWGDQVSSLAVMKNFSQSGERGTTTRNGRYLDLDLNLDGWGYRVGKKNIFGNFNKPIESLFMRAYFDSRGRLSKVGTGKVNFNPSQGLGGLSGGWEFGALSLWLEDAGQRRSFFEGGADLDQLLFFTNSAASEDVLSYEAIDGALAEEIGKLTGVFDEFCMLGLYRSLVLFFVGCFVMYLWYSLLWSIQLSWEDEINGCYEVYLYAKELGFCFFDWSFAWNVLRWIVVACSLGFTRLWQWLSGSLTKILVLLAQVWLAICYGAGVWGG